MASAWLEGVEARVKRAHQHLDTVHEHTRIFIEATKHNFVLKSNPDTDEAWIVYWVTGPTSMMFETSIVIGELLYNLRSALDNLVCALIRVVDPDASCGNRAFPIYLNGDEYAKWGRKITKGMPDKARALIDDLQPYTRGNGAEIDPLNILNTLCNRDKHRTLRVVSGYTGRSLLRLSERGGQAVCEIMLGKRTFSDSPQTIPLPLRARDTPAKAHLEVFGTRAVAFLDPGPWGERSVDEILIACLQYIEQRVIPRFDPFFR